MNKRFCSVAVCFIAAALPLLSAGEKDEDSVRTIRLKQSDAQVHYDSKVYELKNVSAESVLPFINSAIQRYSRNSTVRRVTSADGKREALLVSTGRDFTPYVDQIIAALDRPSNTEKKGIDGTGISRIAYTPRYRAAGQFSELINMTIGSPVGAAYVNGETNTIFWRDQAAAAQNTLKYVEQLDQPLPQVTVRLNYYELRDSDLKDWGFDYLAWKNGPGVNLLNLGYNAGHLMFDEALNSALSIATSASWAFGGFFTAPQFDMSFIRCLQQSGNASVASHAELAMISTPVRSLDDFRRLQMSQMSNIAKAPFVYKVSMTPEYQNIAKNTLGRTFVGKSFYEDDNGKHPDPPRLDALIINPFVCMPEKNGRGVPGGMIFNYHLFFKNVVERGNTGSELSNSVSFTGAATLSFGNEKLLAVYEKENWVEQTIGLPILCRIPLIKYLFSTVTKINERTYIVITAEAMPMNPAGGNEKPVSETRLVERRMDNPFFNPRTEEKKKQEKAAAEKEKQEKKVAAEKEKQEKKAAAKAGKGDKK